MNESQENRIKKTKARHGNEVYINAGRKGGQAKVVKGLAWLKIHDPKGFKEFYQNRSKKKQT